MRYFVQRLEDTYKGLKGKELDLLVELSKQGTTTGLSPSHLMGLISQIQGAEEGLKVAINEFEKISEIDEEHVSKILHPILANSYEDHRVIRVKDKPDYEGLGKELEKRGEGVSCVVRYNGIFDPGVPELWEKHKVKSGNVIDMYHHSMDGVDYSVKDLVRMVGNTVEGVSPEYIIDVVNIGHKHGLHARPSELVASAAMKHLDAHGLEVRVQVDGEDNDVEAHSILQLMMLGAVSGTNMVFKYQKPTTNEQRQATDELRKYMKDSLNIA